MNKSDELWIRDKDAIRSLVKSERAVGRRVGLIPTMGNLHEGHASLFRLAAAECDTVIATIFVNPIQFGPNEDFASYPRTPEEDAEICRAAGVDHIFAPDVATMYPADSTTRVQVVETEKPLCGHNRPGHFVGVATVVTKLFHLVPAHVAVFGAKDFQQCRVIQRMVADLDFDIEIRIGPIVREADGLAMSSRNRYLSPAERQQATVLRRSLDLAADLVANGERRVVEIRRRMIELIKEQPAARIDYVEIVDQVDLAPIETIQRPVVAALAVKFGVARLLDNTVLTPAAS